MQKAKFEKIAEKKAAKKAKKSAPKEEEDVVTDAVTEEAPIDETDIMAEMGTEEVAEETAINESFLKMQKLAGVITESEYNQKKSLIENQLNEDILELKQMSKQLYSFLKSKGFAVELTNQLKKPLRPENPKGGTMTTDKSSVKSEINVEPVQIVVTEGNNEMVSVGITPSTVARVLVGAGDDWAYKASQKFGDDWGKWQTNPEIMKYVDNLGNELLAQIKTKYPNMVYKFEQKDFLYALHFGYGQTKKGGQFNPNDPKNKLAN